VALLECDKSGTLLLFLCERVIHDSAIAPSGRREMFIDLTGTRDALRQAGHVRNQALTTRLYKIRKQTWPS
jgi:hypothetical protein